MSTGEDGDMRMLFGEAESLKLLVELEDTLKRLIIPPNNNVNSCSIVNILLFSWLTQQKFITFYVILNLSISLFSVRLACTHVCTVCCIGHAGMYVALFAYAMDEGEGLWYETFHYPHFL